MAIADLQRRDTEVGRIRLGTKTNGKQHKLDTFRFTSGAQHLIEEIAALYGGEMKPWQNGKKHLFEVITTTNIIPIYLPPQTIDPWYEQWGNAVCVRRCNGIRDLIHDRPCDCNPDDRKCKPTTRVNVMLADVQGLGVWRLETHGIYAAGEMVQLSDRIRGIRMPLPARLFLEQRDGKKFDREKGKVESMDYNVPVIMIDSVTSRHVQLGHDAITQALVAGGHGPTSAPPAIEGPSAPAIEAPKPPQVDPDTIARGLEAIKVARPDQMSGLQQYIVKIGSPELLVAAWKRRSEALITAAAEMAAPPVAAPKPGPILDGGDDERPPFDDDEFPPDDEAPAAAPAAPPTAQQPPARTEAPPAATKPPKATESASTAGDKQAAMTRLLQLAAQKGMKRAALDEYLVQQRGFGLKAAATEDLDFLAAWIGG